MIYIKRLVIENVKSFVGEHAFEFGRGLNFIAGDNNGGKSSLLEALVYLIEGPSKISPGHLKTIGATEPMRVTLDIAGDLNAHLSQEKFVKFRDYMFDVEGEPRLRLQRADHDRTVEQGGKRIDLDGKKITFWRRATQQFENPTGIDALAKSLLELEPVWADTVPSDVIDFGTTKTLGRLMAAATRRFVGQAKWEAFEKAHKEAFGVGEGTLASETAAIATNLQNLISDQYGTAQFRFNFALPDPTIFAKMGELLVDDGAGETPVGGKGTGMQRAITLGMIQLYARSESLAANAERPLILLLDEPETWLHPGAQLKLGAALKTIAAREQLFVVTHSPFLLRHFSSGEDVLVVLAGKAGGRAVSYAHELGLVRLGAPSWAEINFRAFGISSPEFHDELYGEVVAHLKPMHPKGPNEAAIDDFLFAEGVARTHFWKRDHHNAGPGDKRTACVYIRNAVHHPENPHNAPFTEVELEASTRALLAVVSKLKATAFSEEEEAAA